MTYQESAYSNVFAEFPFDFWSAMSNLKSQMQEFQPNVVHHAIARLVNHFNSTHRSGFVITQNVDGFDRASSLGGELFEIHGNLDYMRCSEECSEDLFPSGLGDSPELVQVPTCPRCGAICRPHVLLFDEAYTEIHYHVMAAQTMLESADVLVILGTQLSTGVPKRLAEMA